MTSPRVVGRRERAALLAALASDQVVAVPGAGAYQLAARVDRRAARAKFAALAATHADGVMPYLAVGHTGQALDLASAWTEEAKHLTDRVWPGPLTVILSADHDVLRSVGAEGSSVRISMPTERALRLVCAEIGPVMMAAALGLDGQPLTTVDDVLSRFTETDVALVVNGGTCDGPGPTVVDCTVSPPVVRHTGALPSTYVEAALLMGARRRKRFFGP